MKKLFYLPLTASVALAIWALGFTDALAQGVFDDFGAIPTLSQPPGDQMAANQKLDFHNDLYTGRFNYQIPIEVPPGRGGSEPNIALQYNSANQNGWCGVGWDLDMGYIQRETRYGVPVSNGGYSDTYGNSAGFNTFIYSFEGQSGRLILASDGTYRPEVDTSGLIFYYQDGYWIVVDKEGGIYTFGGTSNSRLTTTYGTFKWGLNQITDANGNQTTVTYQTPSPADGNIYLSQIAYNGNTNSTSISPNCTVTFTLLSGRPDVPSSCLSGKEIDISQVLGSITVACNGNQVREYYVSYNVSPSTGRALLEGVTEYGINSGWSWPAISFIYSEQTPSFQPGKKWGPIRPQNNNNDGTGDALENINAQLIDINGDGLPDWVIQPYNPEYQTNFIVQFNNGHGFGPAQNWGTLNNEDGDELDDVWNTINGIFTPSGVVYPASFLQDVNGDLMPDRVMRQYSSLTGIYDHIQVQTNSGTGFGAESGITGVSSLSSIYFSAEQLTYPLLSTSDGGSSIDLMMDMNGDGVADRVMAGSQAGQFDVQINNRNGTFSSPVAWGNVTGDGPFPYTPRSRDTSHIYSELMDMNGDGLPDRVIQDEGSGGVQLNTGVAGSAAFTSPISWNYGGDPGNVSTASDSYKIQFIDMNGDGLPDAVVSNGNGTYTVYYNTGRGFSDTGVIWTGVSTNTPPGYSPGANSGWSDLQAWDPAGTGTTVEFIDMNGDGLVDRVIRCLDGTGTNMVVQLSTGPFPDLLVGVDNGMGGTLAITYTNASSWNNSDGTRQRLPLPLYTVTSIDEQDGIRIGQQWNYSYVGGLYDPHWREFRGFSQVTESYLNGTGANGSADMTNITYFYQGGGLNNSSIGEYQDSRFKAGMPYQELTYGSDGLLYKILAYQVQQVEIDPNGVYFPFITNSFELDYEGTDFPRETLKQYQYAVTPNDLAVSTGNLLQEADFGEVTNLTYAYAYAPVAGTPNAFTTYSYATLSNPYIIDKPKSVTVSSDAAGDNVLRQTLYTYFGVTGNVQQRNELFCPGTYGTNSYTYDNYGNVLTTTDPMGLVTTMKYDSTATFETKEYIGSLTNGYQYDSGSGNLLYSTNEQGLVTANQYDGLLRLTNSAISTTPNGAATLWRKRYQYSLGGIYDYDDSDNYIHEQQNDPASSTGYHDSYTYLDGLGRPIQIHDQSETSGTYRVSDIFYNQLGQIWAQTYPTFESGSGFNTVSGTPTSFYTADDAIGRPYQFYPFASTPVSEGYLTGYPSPLSGDAGSPVGPVTFSFSDGLNPWAVVVTDARNNVHKYELDAFGRTNQIIEVIGNTNYTSSLSYNCVDDLTNIADSAGNQTSFFYDDMGNRVAMTEPDMGFWQWTYDLDSRLVVQTDAKSQKIEYAYDDSAGRVTTREGLNSGNQVVSSASWQYDSNAGDSSCTVYPGQIYAITDDQGYEKYSYDVRDRTLKSVRFLSQNGSSYTNQFSYDDADRKIAMVYPNGGPTITNIYDSGEHLSQVKLFGGSGTTFYTARAFDAVNQLLGVSFGNGVLTSNSYYPVSLRLEKLAGTHSATSIQSLSYGYDANGNITNIADGVYSGTASAAFGKVQYDALNRMISLTNAAGAFAYGYSPTGNILTNEESGVTSNYVYGTTIRPNCVRSANGIFYTYDLDGNVANRGGMRLIYDVNNDLQYALFPTNTVQYGYDVNGERLWEENGTNRLQVWIGDNYEEKQGDILYHIYAGNRLVATFDKTLTNVFQYYQPNNLTSTSIQTDTNGNVVQHYEYSAFGQSRYTQSSTTFKVSRRYTGQVLDDATGLYYYNARYYDSVLGRFVEPDTEIPDISDPQSYNRYSYCLNDPLRFTDPNGHGYWGDMGSVFEGYYDAGATVVVGTGAMIAHPINTVEGVGSALSHPINTGETIANGVEKSWNSGPRGQGQIVGGVLILVGTALVPEAEASNLPKVGEAANAPKLIPDTASTSRTPKPTLPGPTTDPVTGQKVQRFITDPKGNTLIEPIGGETKPWGRGGADTHTTYPNKSPYQRLDNSHGTPHGHGHLSGTGPGRAGTGPSLDPSGKVVPNNSSQAHWPVKQ